MKFLDERAWCLFVLAALSQLGCTTPSYNDPKGFSSTYFQQIYPDEVFRPNPIPPASPALKPMQMQSTEPPTRSLKQGLNVPSAPPSEPAEATKLPSDRTESLDLHAPRPASSESELPREAELPGESAFLSPRWTFN